MKIQLSHSYENIVSIENLLLAWQEFLPGKRRKRDMQEFQFNLMENILSLHHALTNHTYKHGGYQSFIIHDPKTRIIHKASVRDRLVHHAVYRILYPFFDRTFVSDSFSCRDGKGTHKALNRFTEFGRKVSRNRTRTCWVLKCDIKKFFHSIDQEILLRMLDGYIPDKRIMSLLEEIVGSFNSGRPRLGLPLGNLTSQLFCNIYMNEFDQFVKHRLKVAYYVRYADDFVLLFENRESVVNKIWPIGTFLAHRLHLHLHPDKITIKTLASGVDFLGWVHFPDHRVIRTVTKRRMFRKLSEGKSEQSLNSYLGLLQQGNAQKVKNAILSKIT